MNIEPLLDNLDYIPKEINTERDFISINCPEHGLYYKSVQDIKKQDTECPRCQFLDPGRMHKLLRDAQEEIKDIEENGLGWLNAYVKNRHQPEIFETRALYYKLHITHKETGFQFQKIGVLSTSDEKFTGDLEKDFQDKWNSYKWLKFKIEVVDKIECSFLEAHALEAIYQREHTSLKITVPNELGFNLNKTYEPDFIWQAKSKTIKPLRDAYQARQGNKCLVCGKPPLNPTLDHEHIKKVKGTGFMRGVVCAQCNTFIARAENNAARHGISLSELPEVLRNMADHLEQRKMVIHPTEVPKRKKVGVREWNRVKKYYFKVFPNRKVLPKKPTYVTEQWLELKKEIDAFIAKETQEKEQRKRIKKQLKKDIK